MPKKNEAEKRPDAPSGPTKESAPDKSKPGLLDGIEAKFGKLKESVVQSLDDLDAMLKRKEELYVKHIADTQKDLDNLSSWNPFNRSHREALRQTLAREKDALNDVRNVKATFAPQITLLREALNKNGADVLDLAKQSEKLRGNLARALGNADVSYEAVRMNMQEVMGTETEQDRQLRYDNRMRTVQEEGREVYVRRGDALEKGIVMKKGASYVITNIDEGWEIAVKDVPLDEKGMPKIWTTEEIEKTGQKKFDQITTPKDIGADFGRRKAEYLEKHATLSEDEYAELFGNDIRQANVGNCYLIATFVSLQRFDHADAILRTSIKKNGDSYAVRIPLGMKNGREIVVTKQEMNELQTTAKGEKLQPVNAAEGWKLLEAAFTKMRTGGMNREKTSGGRSEIALAEMMGGHGTEGLWGTRANPEQNRSKNNQNGDVMKGTYNLEVHRGKVEAMLNRFSNGKHLVHLSSLRGPKDDTTQYDIDGHSFYHNHAYSLTNVNAQARTVTVINPHNSGAPIKLTYDQLLRGFVGIDVATIDYKKMFT